MIDLNIVGQNLLALLILGFLGWVIYQKAQGRKYFNLLADTRERFGKIKISSKLRK